MMNNDTHFTAPHSDLLNSKLSAPIYRSKIVKRARLTDRLREGMQCKLTLVIAPAGSGKTTLLREWISITETIGWQVAWVSLDAEDKGILKFWAYVIAALQTIDPDFHFELSSIAGYTSQSFDCDLFISLINQIKKIDKHFSLVLDDYHEVVDEQIHKSLSYVIDHLPENMHLVISSRVFPPIPLSRFRVRNQLIEIDAMNLSFTTEEAGIFMEKVMEVNASSEDIKALNQITEGWIAGLQLAGLTIKSGRELKSFLSDFGSSNRHISDYLTEEVLNHLETSVKEFLIKTSILTKLSADLCDYVLDTNNSQEILLFLEKSNIFIYPLDENRRWYRYHTLFADYLKIHLYNKYPNLINQFHLKAIQWFENHRYPELAIPHALAAGENEKAAEMVEDCALQAILNFDPSTVIQWINQLPLEIYLKRFQLIILNLHAAINLGHNPGIEVHFSELNNLVNQITQNSHNEEEKLRLIYQTTAFRAVAAIIQENYDLCISLSEQMPHQIEERDIYLRGMVQQNLHLAYLAKGRFSDAKDVLAGGLEISSKYHLYKEYIVSKCALARINKFEGNLYEAQKLYQEALLLASEKTLGEDAINYIQTSLGDIHREWNQLDIANQFIKKSLDFVSRFGINSLGWNCVPDIYLLFLKYNISNNEFYKTCDYTHSAYAVTNKYFPLPFLLDQTISTEVRLWLLQNDLSKALAWAEKIQKTLSTNKASVSGILQISLARVLLAGEKADQAEKLLLDITGDNQSVKLIEFKIEAFILLSLSKYKLGDMAGAKEAIISALMLAQPGGYIRIFIDEGPILKKILTESQKELQKQSHEIENFSQLEIYLNQLLSNFGINFKNQNNHFKTQDIDLSSHIPFSNRELEVLKLISEGKSPKHISKQLVVSINTVHTHIKNIYKKLEVHNRKEAIEKALYFHLI